MRARACMYVFFVSVYVDRQAGQGGREGGRRRELGQACFRPALCVAEVWAGRAGGPTTDDSIMGVRISGTPGDIDPLNKVPFKRATSRVHKGPL